MYRPTRNNGVWGTRKTCGQGKADPSRSEHAKIGIAPPFKRAERASRWGTRVGDPGVGARDDSGEACGTGSSAEFAMELMELKRKSLRSPGTNRRDDLSYKCASERTLGCRLEPFGKLRAGRTGPSRLRASRRYEAPRGEVPRARDGMHVAAPWATRTDARVGLRHSDRVAEIMMYRPTRNNGVWGTRKTCAKEKQMPSRLR